MILFLLPLCGNISERRCCIPGVALGAVGAVGAVRGGLFPLFPLFLLNESLGVPEHEAAKKPEDDEAGLVAERSRKVR